MGQFSFLIRQLLSSLPKPTTSCVGKTVIVTGSNTGLGLEAARHFTRLGAAAVILAVRSVTKGEAARDDIEASTGCKGVIQVWHLDMASYQSVLQFAARAASDLERIDTVILNAGIGPMKWEMLEQDESTITVNVVSTFLLALALLPALKATNERHQIRPNLTIVASEMHMVARFPERNAPTGQILDALNKETQDMQERYNVSKLLVVLLVRAMVGQQSSSSMPVTINSVCPGFCHSDITRDVMGPLHVVMTIMKAIFARSTEEGSRTLVHAATQGPESHGKYLSNCTMIPPSPFVVSQDGQLTQERVWSELAQKFEVIKPGILSNL